MKGYHLYRGDTHTQFSTRTVSEVEEYLAEHWAHIRTSSPIESTFATVWLRIYKTKACGSRTVCLTMVFKLVRSAEGHWRRLNGSKLLAEVIRAVRFADGLKQGIKQTAA